METAARKQTIEEADLFKLSSNRLLIKCLSQAMAKTKTDILKNYSEAIEAIEAIDGDDDGDADGEVDVDKWFVDLTMKYFHTLFYSEAEKSSMVLDVKEDESSSTISFLRSMLQSVIVITHN